MLEQLLDFSSAGKPSQRSTHPLAAADRGGAMGFAAVLDAALPGLPGEKSETASPPVLSIPTSDATPSQLAGLLLDDDAPAPLASLAAEELTSEVGEAGTASVPLDEQTADSSSPAGFSRPAMDDSPLAEADTDGVGKLQPVADGQQFQGEAPEQVLQAPSATPAKDRLTGPDELDRYARGLSEAASERNETLVPDGPVLPSGSVTRAVRGGDAEAPALVLPAPAIASDPNVALAASVSEAVEGAVSTTGLKLPGTAEALPGSAPTHAELDKPVFEPRPDLQRPLEPKARGGAPGDRDSSQAALGTQLDRPLQSNGVLARSASGEAFVPAASDGATETERTGGERVDRRASTPDVRAPVAAARTPVIPPAMPATVADPSHADAAVLSLEARSYSRQAEDSVLMRAYQRERFQSAPVVARGAAVASTDGLNAAATGAGAALPMAYQVAENTAPGGYYGALMVSGPVTGTDAPSVAATNPAAGFESSGAAVATGSPAVSGSTDAERVGVDAQRVGDAKVDFAKPGLVAEQLARTMQAEFSALRSGELSRQTLRLALAPQSLGELEIRFEQNERGELNVRITTPSPVTRDVLEPHLARVRASLEDSGMRMGTVDVNVGDQHSGNAMGHTQAEQQQRSPQSVPEGAQALSAVDDSSMGSDRSSRPGASRLLDTFA